MLGAAKVVQPHPSLPLAHSCCAGYYGDHNDAAAAKALCLLAEAAMAVCTTLVCAFYTTCAPLTRSDTCVHLCNFFNSQQSEHVFFSQEDDINRITMLRKLRNLTQLQLC